MSMTISYQELLASIYPLPDWSLCSFTLITRMAHFQTKKIAIKENNMTETHRHTP